MSASAANALLKTLEEPRTGSYIILITSMSASLLPTVRSRCQTVRFGALSDETVVDLLEQKGHSREEALLISAICKGSMKKAAEYNGEDFARRIKMVSALLEGAMEKTPQKALEVAELLRQDREEAFAVLELLLFVLEEIMWQRADYDNVSVDVSSSLLARLPSDIAVSGQRGSVILTANHMAAVNKAIVSMRRNNMNSQLAIEGLIMAMRGRSADDGWMRIGVK
jgi:DNA polymerase-3 subunit delta'